MVRVQLDGKGVAESDMVDWSGKGQSPDIFDPSEDADVQDWLDM